MSDVVIFGVSDSAQLAHYYLTRDSDHTVVGFCVDREYLPENLQFEGLPVVDSEHMAQHFPATEVQLLVPMVAVDMNRARAKVYQRFKQSGYRFVSYISSRATVLTGCIGENCFILENNTLQPFTEIGDNVILWSGNHVGHHSRIQDHVFVSSQVVISGRCDIGAYSYLGVNSTLRDYLNLAPGSFIGMGSVVTKPTEPWQAYAGSPARWLRKASTDIKIYNVD